MDTYEIRSSDRTAQPAAVRVANLSVSEFPAWLGETYAVVAGHLARQGAYPVGPPFARYRPLGSEKFQVEAGFPVATPIAGDDDVVSITLPAGPAAATVHIGEYDNMVPGYRAIADWIAAHRGQPAGDPWEVYFSDPRTQPDPTTWRTEIVQPYHLAVQPSAPQS